MGLLNRNRRCLGMRSNRTGRVKGRLMRTATQVVVKTLRQDEDIKRFGLTGLI